MADKTENFIYVPVCKRCYKTHPNPVTYSVGRSGEVLTVEKFVEAIDEEDDGETLSSTEEMSSDSDVEMTDSFIVDDADSGISDSDDSYEPSEDDE